MSTLSNHQLVGTRFGTLDVKDEDIYSFESGLVGFSDLKRFVLVNTSSASSFCWLQSLERPELAFLLTDPLVYLRTYEPAATVGDECAVFTTVNIPPGKPQEMTLNLAGPIYVDAADRKGWQVVLDNGAYTTKHRVFAEASDQCGEQVA